MKVLRAALLIALVFLAIPALAGAQESNSGGSEYLPSVPGASGPRPEGSFSISSSLDAPQPGEEAPEGAGLTGAGHELVGPLFPVLLGAALLASLAVIVRRVRAAG